MTEINTKLELISALRDANQHAQVWFSGIPAQEFFTRQGEVWSASDNLDHMIKAVKPITQALKLPNMTLLAMFGKPKAASKTYEEICKIYLDAITKGAQASGRYLPEEIMSGESMEDKKTQLIEKFSRTAENLISAVETWDEAALDQYQLPHPILGKLTVREMLFFSVYHTLRHASREGD